VNVHYVTSTTKIYLKISLKIIIENPLWVDEMVLVKMKVDETTFPKIGNLKKSVFYLDHGHFLKQDQLLSLPHLFSAKHDFSFTFV